MADRGRPLNLTTVLQRVLPLLDKESDRNNVTELLAALERLDVRTFDRLWQEWPELGPGGITRICP